MTTVTPTPHQLPVSYYSDLVGEITQPLNKIRERVYVAAIGRIEHITTHDRARPAVRATVILTSLDNTGHTAYCSLDTETRSRVESLLEMGREVRVSGTVRYLPDGQPVIDVGAIHPHSLPAPQPL